MDHKEYMYVDVALGDVTKRNNVSDLNGLKIPSRKTNCYTTYFRFRKEYVEHVIATGTVRGANKFLCWSDFLWFDIDGETLTDALANVKRLLIGLETLHATNHTVVFFSGSKGFHVGVDAGLFGFEPSVQLPQQMRQTAERIATMFSVTIDTVVYNHNRLWRVPGTLHSKTKLRKTLLDISDILAITNEKQLIASVKKIKAITPAYWTCDNSEPLPAMMKLVTPLEKPVTKGGQWFDPGPTDRQLDEMNVALELLLKQGEPEGSRDSGAILRASECRKVGYSQDDTLELIQVWNELNEPPLEEDDLNRVVKSAFRGDGYDFGTKSNDPLCDARTRARELVKEYQDDDDEDDDSKYKYPRSLTEWRSDPNMGKLPDRVGEYISWRGHLSLFVGAAKLAGKSTLCTFEAKFALEKGLRVLWFTNDEPINDVVRRFVDAQLNPSASDRLFVSASVTFPEDWNHVEEQIRHVKPDLIIFDSLHSIFPIMNKGKLPEQSETAEWQSLLLRLRPIAEELDLAIVWIHHANKIGVAAGSVGLIAAADVIVNITQVSATRSPTRRKLEYLGRFVALKEVQLRYDGPDTGYTELNFSTSSEVENKDYNVLVAMETWLIELFSAQAHNNYSMPAKAIKAQCVERFNSDFASERACIDNLYKARKGANIKMDKPSRGMWTMETSPCASGDSDDE